MSFKVEIRKTCKICGKPIIEKRFRTYCSKECRNKSNNRKHKDGGYSKAWYRKKSAKFEPGKIQCKICGGWYNQLGSHVVQRHKITAREYRIEFGYDRKAGKSILSKNLHELYGKQALENGTCKNLKKGKKYWFKKGEPNAGNYKRSAETMERLKTLYKFNKQSK